MTPEARVPAMPEAASEAASVAAPEVVSVGASEVVSEATARHRHRWLDGAFSFEGGHPRYTARCACGAERSIRAWERFWDGRPPEAMREGMPEDER